MSSEDLLAELVGFLAPANRTDVRAMAATHIAELSGGDVLSAGPKAKQIWETEAIPQLVRWLGDNESVAKPCRIALANLSAISLFYPASSSIAHRKEFWRWLIDDVKQSGPLLVNLTSHPNGPDKVEEHILGGTNRACAELLGAFAVSKDVQVREWCMAAVRNLTTHEGARRGLTESKPSLKVLLETTALGSTSAQRRDAAGTLRNLLVNKDTGVHARVLSADGSGWLTAGLVLGLGAEACPSFAELSETLSEERKERVNMSPTLASMFKGELAKRACEDPDRDHRDLVVDCLLLIASMRFGREKLREVKVYPAIRAYHPLEKDEPISDKVYDLVDFLIQDEDNFENDNVDKAPSTSAAPAASSSNSSDAAWSVD